MAAAAPPPGEGPEMTGTLNFDLTDRIIDEVWNEEFGTDDDKGAAEKPPKRRELQKLSAETRDDKPLDPLVYNTSWTLY